MSDAFAPPTESLDAAPIPADTKPVSTLGTVLKYGVLGWTVLTGITMVSEILSLIVGWDSFGGELVLMASGLLALLTLPVLLACMIVWGIWSFRVAKNLKQLGEEVGYTPGWVVGWWFVPFANLVMPYRVHKGLFMATNMEGEPDPPYLLWWWLTWIGTGILGQISFRLTMNGAEEAAYFVDPFVSIVGIINGALAYMLVRDLTARHTAQLEAAN